MQKHLVIFAKEPRIGRVKTRLARDIGKVAAWRFYRSMLLTIPKRLQGAWRVWLAISPDHAHMPYGVRVLKQGRGDLGQRMLRPARRLPPGPFIVVGTDVPDIQPSHIKKAFALLGKNDVVFGPAQDGGFWLVGHKRHPVLTDPYKGRVRWSHPETLKDCLSNLKAKKVGFVDVLCDVDCADDLNPKSEKRRRPV